jgi:hypothetical protein
MRSGKAVKLERFVYSEISGTIDRGGERVAILRHGAFVDEGEMDLVGYAMAKAANQVAGGTE